MPRSLTRTSSTPAAAAMRSRISAPAKITSARRGSRPMHPLPLRLSRPAQAGDFAAEIGARQAVAVNARRIVAREGERHGRQRGDGARDADQGRRLARKRDGPDGRVDRAGYCRPLVVRGRIVMDQRLRQPNGSERQAGSEPDLPAGGEHDLGRTAADVDDDQLSGADIRERRDDRAKRQRRFTLAVDHLDLGAQDLGGRIQERGGVGGAAERLRADGGDAGVVAARDGREVAQHVQRAGDGFAIERAAAADAAAEPGDLGAFLDHVDGGIGPRHQQQRRVGADVDGGEVHPAHYRRLALRPHRRGPAGAGHAADQGRDAGATQHAPVMAPTAAGCAYERRCRIVRGRRGRREPATTGSTVPRSAGCASCIWLAGGSGARPAFGQTMRAQTEAGRRGRPRRPRPRAGRWAAPAAAGAACGS